MHTELLKEKENIQILIPEAPIVNPNAALGTPPRLNSDGEDPEIEEIMDTSEGTDEGMPDVLNRYFSYFIREKERSSYVVLFDAQSNGDRRLGGPKIGIRIRDGYGDESQ